MVRVDGVFQCLTGPFRRQFVEEQQDDLGFEPFVHCACAGVSVGIEGDGMQLAQQVDDRFRIPVSNPGFQLVDQCGSFFQVSLFHSCVPCHG